MTPADLDAIVHDALREASYCNECGHPATRICRGCASTWCDSHNGDDPHAPQCDEGMAPLHISPRLAMARALREAWQERDGLNDARNVLADAVTELTQERDEWKHVAEQRDVDGAALASRLRADKAEQRQRAERAEHERDAALAAVDAVRADYAPRDEPPTADEVRALAGLRGDGFDAQWVARFAADTLVTAVVSVGVGSAGAVVCHDFAGERIAAGVFATWEARGPSGPLAWSELAALVRGGDRG